MKRSNRLLMLVGVFLAVVVFVAIALLLSAAHIVPSATPEQAEVHNVRLPDGRTVLCIRVPSVGGPVSCDWEHAK